MSVFLLYMLIYAVCFPATLADFYTTSNREKNLTHECAQEGIALCAIWLPIVTKTCHWAVPLYFDQAN